MFTSQPQIGQEMASERQRQAAQIRQATEARAARDSTEVAPSRRWVGIAGAWRRLATLARRSVAPPAN